MRILITGSNGFIGSNLRLFISKNKKFQILTFCRKDSLDDLNVKIKESDLIVHLAGVNRSPNKSDFFEGNTNLTEIIVKTIQNIYLSEDRKIPIIFASSIHFDQNTFYGQSKNKAEEAILKLNKETGINVHIYRLSNIFGKWSKPNYNSVVSTFCFNVANNKPIEINDKNYLLKLLYIDDVVLSISDLIDSYLNNNNSQEIYLNIEPVYNITVGELADIILSFRQLRLSGRVPETESGILRALYSTFISFLPQDKFAYEIESYSDVRGKFVEFIKTKTSGQFGYFTIEPGMERGNHYHHSKTEKFIVIHGLAKFTYENLNTKESFELIISEKDNKVIDSIPGWAHKISNEGKSNAIILVWSNEIFNPLNSDTFPYMFKE